AQGLSILVAARQAAAQRLRPILMTSLAFILGVLPLVISSGPGSEMRQALGIAVFFGMIGVTIFGLLFTPAFYVMVRTLEDRIKAWSASHKRADLPPPSPPAQPVVEGSQP
ncbi:MAG: efflux RND transporter permease subunit, partial [Blastomonas fulva]